MDDKTAYTQGVYPPTAPPAQYGQYGQSQGQLQPQYQQQQYGQPVQAYPDPGPQVVYVQQQVSQQAPGLLDMRSMQEQAADTNRTMQNPDGKKDIDQVRGEPYPKLLYRIVPNTYAASIRFLSTLGAVLPSVFGRYRSVLMFGAVEVESLVLR